MSIIDTLKAAQEPGSSVELSRFWQHVPKDYQDEVAQGKIPLLDEETIQITRDIFDETQLGINNQPIANYLLDGTRQRITNEGSSKFMVIGANSAFARALFGSLSHYDLCNGHHESAITAVSMRAEVSEFKDQDLLYATATCRTDRDGHEIFDYDVNGSYVEALEAFELEDFKRTVKRFYEMKCVALVLTKDGYCCMPNLGEIDLEHPDIRHDLEIVRKHFVENEGDLDKLTDTPKTVFGLLAISIGYAKRLHESNTRLREDPEFSLPVVIPADNLPVYVEDFRDGKKEVKFGAIGQYTKRSLQTFLTEIGLRDLATYTHTNLRVPNTMVDRITSKFGPSHVEDVFGVFGGVDARIVVTEGKPKYGALMIDKFDYDRPGALTFSNHQKLNWMRHFGDVELVQGEDPDNPNYVNRRKAALFSPDAAVWAELKSRTINTTHVVIAYFGKYLGMERGFVHEVMQVPGVEGFLRSIIKNEIWPRLSEVPRRLRKPGEIDAYLDDVMNRMKNSANPDKISRLDTEGAIKIPDRVLSIISHTLYAGQDDQLGIRARRGIRMLTLVAAVWLTLAITRKDQNGKDIKLVDSRINPDPDKTSAPSIFNGINDPLDDFNQVMHKQEIFGEQLGENQAFLLQMRTSLRLLKRYTLGQLLRIGKFDESKEPLD